MWQYMGLANPIQNRLPYTGQTIAGAFSLRSGLLNLVGSKLGAEQQRFENCGRWRCVTRHVAAGRMTAKGEKEMRAAFAKTVFIVDEGSLASTVQARDLLRIANALRIPRLVLVGDEKQLDAVDAGKPFAQLQAAGLKTALMDQIMRQRDPALKDAVEASLAGDIARAFEKLGDNVAEVNPDNLAGAAAARWLALPPEAREHTGLMAPSHALREGINELVRERLTGDGIVHGPAMANGTARLRGYTNAEKALARNYMAGDVVGFHRPYKRLGVEKGDELRVAGVDRTAGTVTLAGKDGGTVAWEPGRIAARAGGVEVYKRETMELRAGDRIRWTRNDAGLGLVNSQTAEVTAVRDGRVGFRLEDGRMLDMNAGDPQLRHIDRAWASTVHAFQGRTVDTVIAAIEANHPNLTTQKMLYVEISRARDRKPVTIRTFPFVQIHAPQCCGATNRGGGRDLHFSFRSDSRALIERDLHSYASTGAVPAALSGNALSKIDAKSAASSVLGEIPIRAKYRAKFVAASSAAVWSDSRPGAAASTSCTSSNCSMRSASSSAWVTSWRRSPVNSSGTGSTPSPSNWRAAPRKGKSTSRRHGVTAAMARSNSWSSSSPWPQTAAQTQSNNIFTSTSTRAKCRSCNAKQAIATASSW